ncbi:VCBS repeat-containing protein [Flavilitoribacter nigricans]|uniref:RNA-binding protein n=1 Tax=Flavilitoribacter nigricans (strain ATCC 23147 / DSM 23189 / NBRC 102662 / NCIMB 1420 / SS-2) TaxID=1122177 RepID=A0A2D0N1C1_FLAN2|nr:VCBS repeat-containing protein [Flavilitoribacter nigricans]PHN01513.1 RNA-binding protein [Flavilitoribacter nigricans DSM 23189 = NBRC 102662]
MNLQRKTLELTRWGRGGLYLLLALVCFGACRDVEQDDSTTPSDPSAPPLFTLLTPQETRVDFQNTLDEGLNTNILMYEYFYNGGGVAAGDLNGDSLIDLYFTSNMANNKLYINQGNMQFRDVTAISGASGIPGPWKTGVTMADVNGDNRLDIYISYSGALPNEKRQNQLFINQGVGTNGTPLFREMAEAYGLASAGYSNQAYFFDYDRDGDLDALLLNHNPKNLPVLNVSATKAVLQKDDPLQGVRLYKQQDGTFTDATVEVGISSSALTYGLGIGITDINEDGWPDFYISNDYAVPDYLYINNGDGTFTDKIKESMGQNSHFSMGNDVADINNDGLPDIVTLDMLPEDNYRQKLLLAPDNYAKFDLNEQSGFHRQYMRNMLQLNNGNGTFSEIGQMAGISNTDWSWAALLADYDNDGWKDLFITNGYLRDYTNLDFIKYMDDYVQSKGRLVRDDVLEIIGHMPASNVVNYIFSNQNGEGFTNRTANWGMDRPSNSNGAAYADLDNDGDLDLIVNNINQPAYIYRNDAGGQLNNNYLQVRLRGAGMNTQGIGAKVLAVYNGQRQKLEQYLSRGYLSSVSPVMHFGLGTTTTLDSLVVIWPSGKQQTLTDVRANQVIELSEGEATETWTPARKQSAIFTEVSSPVKHQEPTMQVRDFDRQPLLISELSYMGPFLLKEDLNGDDLPDIFIGGGRNQAASLYLQSGNGQFRPVDVPAFTADQAPVDAAAVAFDANGDGHPDLYVASGGYHDLDAQDEALQDRLYLNDGQGNFTRSADALPEMLVSKGTVLAKDINGDGHQDLFVGGRVIPGRYPETPASYLLINDGSGRFTDQTEALAPELSTLGMVTDAAWADLDQDGTEELLVVGEWMPLTVYRLTNGQLENSTLDFFNGEYRGWWNTITVDDLNGDQRADLVLGNIGTNTQFRVSSEEPAEIYFADFDDNGSVDPIFCFYIQGKSYPYVTRDEMLGQLSGLRSRYTTYKDYADLTIGDIFATEELRDAKRLEANRMETTLFLSGSGKFEPAALPVEAQFAPVYTVTVLDYNADGNKDLLLCGNNSHAKLRLGRFDANYGILLEGDGRGGFRYIDQQTSGFAIKGDVRSVVELDNTLLFGLSEGPVKAYRKN